MTDLIQRAIDHQVSTDRQIIMALRLAGFTAERMPDHRGLVVRKRAKGGKFSLNCNGVSNALELAGLGFPITRVDHSNFYDRPYVVAQ